MPKNHRRAILAIGVTAAIALSIVCFAAAEVRRKRSTVAPSVNAADRSNVEGIVFSVQPYGIEPSEVNIAKGSYLFIVQNRTNVRDLTFRIDRQAGGRVHEVRGQKLQWKKIFDFNPGTYELTVADHPEWRSVITVRAR